MNRPPLDELFRPNESPYFAMHRAGLLGYGIGEVSQFLIKIGVPIREKDIRNWQAGAFRSKMRSSVLNPILPGMDFGVQTIGGKIFEDSSFEDLDLLPPGWVATPNRWFPCNSEGAPMQRWGWKPDYEPSLYDYASAKALSPRGWVGQNMLYQDFIVLDIDGVGHGIRDEAVISFGEMYKNRTMCFENPLKPGSFHLYFATDRLIPVKHFPFAKLDLMGNSKNAAVYLKDKQPNGLPMMELDENVWEEIKRYVKFRKETR